MYDTLAKVDYRPPPALPDRCSPLLRLRRQRALSSRSGGALCARPSPAVAVPDRPLLTPLALGTSYISVSRSASGRVLPPALALRS